MVSERELELAIAETSPYTKAGETFAYTVALIDYSVVRAFGERFAQVKNEAGASRDEAIVGAFLLAFRLGVIAARHEEAEL